MTLWVNEGLNYRIRVTGFQAESGPFVLDGWPEDSAGVEALAEAGIRITVAIALDVPLSTRAERIDERSEMSGWDFFSDEEQLREIWSRPDTRRKLLEGLSEKGYSTEQLAEISQAIRMGRMPAHDNELNISHSSLKVNMKQAAQNVGTPVMSPQTFIFIIEQIIHVTQSLQKDATRVAVDLANAYPSIESDDTVAA